ncbi:rho guanine nucleotide exchange factor 15 [Thunnus maccoyii]|uniref:rho guanine nucleotide exchange factor 15 n=1 Tax=Thunnus maccoyii TaxID=8240 RepID=UPI001C4C1A60|nr:rho guanine nucleotide exchange factor 15 [Thunnus maccoyii]XP_042256621.1 rho guanine nucleotide exchange factor 15 [Thunnus maccoyii]XP_042256623.1 rho guanine nucleotide exchange factor 15 [Thunnus maccoyii]
MSVQEVSPPPTSPLPLKPETKPRPEIPPKPSTQTSSPPLGDRGSSGKVKRIVNKFSKQESASNEANEHPTNGSAELKTSKRFKRPPTIKPKPGRASLQLQIGREQAPPLPAKRSRVPQKQKESLGGEEGDGIGVEGRRSAPDGKEVEVQLNGGGEAEVERSPDTPLSPCCDPCCGCVCHFQRPGMKLIWVPVDVEDGEEEEVEETEEDGTDGEEDRSEEGEDKDAEVERGGEGDSEADEDEVDRTSVVDEGEVSKQDKAKFYHSLDVLISEGNRRRSDPGPHAVLMSRAVTRSQSPPVPPKQSQSPPIQKSIHEEENIYEATLPVFDPTPKKSTSLCKELDIPLIKVRKPARQSKLPSSTSDPTSEFQVDVGSVSSPDDVPPAIPPRMPVTQDSRSLTPVHRSGIPLPQPTLEEWRSLRPSSPSSSTASGLSPQRAITPPPTSSLQPQRPPPPPPKTDPRRLSSASMQSLTQKKEGEENGGNEGEKEETMEEPRPVRSNSLRRESSFSWESRLQDEPLYQTYRATVITKEIRRQTVCRNISKTSVDYAMDWNARLSGTGTPTGTGTATGNGAPKSSPVPTPGQSTLWQDLPAVRDSGVLEQLTPEQCKYQESMFEVLTSEASYLRSLRVLTEHFLDSRDLEETMIIRDKKTLFSNILRVREVSERFLKDLEDRIFENFVFSDICDIIHYHAQHNFPAYIDYVRNQIYQEKIYTSLMKNNVQFASVITRLQESPQCQRLPFMSFLLLPFQRITRIKMLIENILKRTKEGTKEEQTASKALASVSKIIDECNTQVGKMRQMEELIHVSQTLEFDKLKAIPIISQTRYLEKKGELQEMSKGGTLFNMRAKFTPVYLFLFNDLLIIATKKGAERFVVLDHAHRSLVQVQPIEEGGSSAGPYEHCFNLTLLENHQGRMMERLFKAPSQSDMHRWMAAFPNPTNPDRDEDEVIYEDWDCPQVNCVEQYIAQQADELTLEPTEIINVIRKTNEGWYEGIRLSDGQKGWFPIANVIEITNEHVRRRNLRERYRVIQAASIVANSKTRTVQ